MNNIPSFPLCWINNKGYYYQSYGKNHKMREIAILVENWGGQNKNNLMICFLNMTKEGVLFGADTLHFYIKGIIKNDSDCAFNSLNEL